MTRGFPSKLDTDTLNHTLQRYAAGALTRKQVAAELDISEDYVKKLLKKSQLRKLPVPEAAPGEGVNARSKAAAQERADTRDQAVIDVVYSGMTARAAAEKHGVHWNLVHNWITAYNAELRNPTPEDQRPRETDKRNLKSWAFFAVCRIEARMREEV